MDILRNLKKKVEIRDKNKNNKLMSLLMHDDKLLQKYKVIWIEDLKNI